MDLFFSSPKHRDAVMCRDTGIQKITARKGIYGYGMGLGILLLDDVYPAFPGDVRNPSAYPFPIQYEIVQGIDIYRLVIEPDKSPCLDPLCQAAKKLEKMGCRAIAAECGYFAFFQREIAAAVDVPVFMSSLLQVPLAQQVIRPDQVVGLLMANSNYLSDHHLTSAGIRLGSNFVVGGAMENYECVEFDHLWTKELRSDPPAADYRKAESEFIKVAVQFFRKHPNMGAMVLECTGFPPFARALQREIGIPVFSWGTLLDYAWSVVVHRDYCGHV